MTEGTPNNQSSQRSGQTPGNDGDDRVQDWWRIAPMIFFALIAYFVLWLMFIGALLQYISVAAQGEKTEQISGFNRSVRQYLIDIFDYLTYGRDDMPFPFGDFPFTNAPQGRSTHEGVAPESPAPRPAKPEAPQAAAAAAAAPAPKPKAAPRAKPASAARPKPAAKRTTTAPKPATAKKPAAARKPAVKRTAKPAGSGATASPPAKPAGGDTPSKS